MSRLSPPSLLSHLTLSSPCHTSFRCVCLCSFIFHSLIQYSLHFFILPPSSMIGRIISTHTLLLSLHLLISCSSIRLPLSFPPSLPHRSPALSDIRLPRTTCSVSPFITRLLPHTRWLYYRASPGRGPVTTTPSMPPQI